MMVALHDEQIQGLRIVLAKPGNHKWNDNGKQHQLE